MDNRELKILFSEQNNETVQNIRRFFDSKGIKTCFCGKDGNEVLQAIEQIKPQVVVIDVFLQKLDGIAELIRPLGVVGDGDKRHIQNDLGNQPADLHSKIAQDQTAHYGERVG